MASPEHKANLIKVLEETRELLARPDNDFLWSQWRNSKEALAEMDDFISKIKNDQPFDAGTLWFLFAPTGSIQEVSFSGWAGKYLELAERFDKAFERYTVPPKPAKPSAPPKGPKGPSL